MVQRNHVRAMASSSQDGHRVPQTNVTSTANMDPEIRAFREHQAGVARLTIAEEAKTLVSTTSFGVLSTISSLPESAGYPAGSVVEYALDSQGRLVFSFSMLSTHTPDVQADGRCSVTVMASGFRGLADSRVNIIGTVRPIPEAEYEAVAEAYLAQNPKSFWVKFGDFSWWRMDDIISARLIGGFGRIGTVTGQEFNSATADPIATFSAPVCSHMNQDHSDATVAMVKYVTGLTVDAASMISLDRLGINVECQRDGQAFKARLPFPAPVEDRKGIKDAIVAMTRDAQS